MKSTTMPLVLWYAAERFFHNNMTTVKDYSSLKTALEKHFGPANKMATNLLLSKGRSSS